MNIALQPRVRALGADGYDGAIGILQSAAGDEDGPRIDTRRDHEQIPLIPIAHLPRAHRTAASFKGLQAEVLDVDAHDGMSINFTGSGNLLVFRERGTCRGADVGVGDMSPERLWGPVESFTIVPAMRALRETQVAGANLRLAWFLIDPTVFPMPHLSSRVLFKDDGLASTARKLTSFIAEGCSDEAYLSALVGLLVRELVRLDRTPAIPTATSGGLAGWQRRVAARYIEEHVSEPIELTTLAGLVRLSSCHFCRAFKLSFGQPPHRYHLARRIDQAKTLLADSRLTVTEIGLALGFAETSSFSATFRRMSGLTPTAYRRALETQRSGAPSAPLVGHTETGWAPSSYS